MKKTIALIALLVVLSTSGCIFFDKNAQEISLAEPIERDITPTVEQEVIEEPLIEVQVDPADEYDFMTTLTDVSGGDASGTAYATFEDVYLLYAEFENLPEPEGEDFYEGWVVRNSPLEVLSTGKAVLEEGKYVNNFTDEVDLTDHDFYVLTLEPNDGDPAPATHILEGTLIKSSML